MESLTPDDVTRLCEVGTEIADSLYWLQCAAVAVAGWHIGWIIMDSWRGRER